HLVGLRRQRDAQLLQSLPPGRYGADPRGAGGRRPAARAGLTPPLYNEGRMTDARTLRLAHPDISPERLEAFIAYQRTLLKALLETSGDDWAGRFAFGHAKALKASALESLEQRRIASAVEAFCGRRSAAEAVAERLAEARRRVAEAQAKGEQPSAKDV